MTSAPRFLHFILVTGLLIASSIESNSAWGETSQLVSSEKSAQVSNQDVSLQDIKDFLQSFSPEERQALSQNPQLFKKNLEDYFLQHLLYREALAKQWDKNPLVIAQLKRNRENTIVQSYLSSLSKPPPDYPNPAELEETFAANKSKLLIPRMFHLAQIFIAQSSNSDAKTIDKVSAKVDLVRLEVARLGSDFAQIANKESDDHQSSDKGGDLGWLSEHQVQPEIAQQILTLGKNSVSQPIHLNDGWHFIKLLEVKQAHTPELSEVRDQLSQQMREVKENSAKQKYILDLMAKNPIYVDINKINSLLQQK